MTVQTLAILVLLVSFFVMIFLRFPIAYAVGLSSVFCMMVQGQALTDVCRLMVKGISSFSLMAVPFFITMGVLMGSGGISEKLIALADACVGWEDHYKEADKKDNDCQCLNCHITLPPLQKCS